MCLSTVYLDTKDDSTIMIKEASQIVTTPSAVEVSSLFGGTKSVPGYAIGEINLLDNYIVLIPRKDP